MKKKLIYGLLLVAVAGFVFGNTPISNTAETIPPEPWGIIFIK